MRRLGRILLNFVTVLSLLLSLWMLWIIFDHHHTRDGFSPRWPEPRLYVGRYHLYVFGFGISYWVLALAFLFAPLMWIVPMLRHRAKIRDRIALSLCARCGYDLRATPDRCPECGAVPVSTHGSASD